MDQAARREPLTLYLDVDGVLTTAGYQRRAGADRLDPAEVAIVASLVRDLGGVVVVSSTWRVADCRPTLVAAGLPAGCFHADWRTAIPDTSRDPETGGMLPADRARRGDEIAEHAARNGITRYLVLDDVDVGLAHRGRHVRPDPECGITEAEGALARELVARMDAASDGK
ncbi:HAD domain-containing protein [Lichenibacterium dinghuense]|uniref:HAD domain-containing protein n=1 Tax=Lichenibacterium dinghuense TaxID=2895977 RepID=UPI001F281EF0|nr:HAD domain-containing protein [Lichenibacterium sp. 6Y81]